MIDFKKLLFFLAMILFFYILYLLIVQRQRIKQYINEQTRNESETIQEPFASIPYIDSTKNTDLSLKEYMIMSSWNSAVDKNGNVSLDTLEKTIERGYRFLDMEIYLVDKSPYVGFSSDKSYNTMESDPVLFYDVCQKILAKAFVTNNHKDPMLLHLRIKSTSDTVFNQIADILESVFEKYLYRKKVNGNTKLEEIMGKIVIIVDRTYIPQISKYSCEDNCRHDFIQLTNTYSGTGVLKSVKEHYKLDQMKRPLEISTEGKSNVEDWQMVTLGVGEYYRTNNTKHFYTLAEAHSVQIIPQRVSSKDEHLMEYEDFFKRNGKRAFVPITVIL